MAVGRCQVSWDLPAEVEDYYMGNDGDDNGTKSIVTKIESGVVNFTCVANCHRLLSHLKVYYV